MQTMIPSPQGRTRIYAVIGHPVTQVQAPRLMNALFSEHRADAVMVPIHASPGELATVVAGLMAMGNCDGILVTIPHKFAVAGMVKRRSAMVELTGAANALRRDADGLWSAENFDGRGFVAGLRRAGQNLAAGPVMLFGAGGAGVSIAAALLEGGVRRLHVIDPAVEKAEALSQRLSMRWPGMIRTGPAPLRDAALVVNATPLGLRTEDPLPFDPADLEPGTRVADIIMEPSETRLLRAAARSGLPVQPGLPMLTEQIPLYRDFFGIMAPVPARQRGLE
jgi:shikimate dehydrogenase